MYVFFFFFSSRRRHTRFDCDWSSDVCSSDLASRRNRAVGAQAGRSGAVRRPRATRPVGQFERPPGSGRVGGGARGGESGRHSGQCQCWTRPAGADRFAGWGRRSAQLGAIIRTTLAAGAHGVVIPERRAAGLTDAVARASAGALAHLPVAKVTNLVRTMEELKEAGYWLVGLDEQGDKNYTEVDYTSPGGIGLGSEGQGLHELTRKRCDFVVSLPKTGPGKSLNVSGAACVVLFEALTQRTARTKAK